MAAKNQKQVDDVEFNRELWEERWTTVCAFMQRVQHDLYGNGDAEGGIVSSNRRNTEWREEREMITKELERDLIKKIILIGIGLAAFMLLSNGGTVLTVLSAVAKMGGN